MAKPDRITIRLDRELSDRLEAEARRQRRPVSDVARLALEDNLPPLVSNGGIAAPSLAP